MKPSYKKHFISKKPSQLKRSLLASSVLLPLTITSAPVHAQSLPEGPTQRVTALEEVIVTARRRQESLQDVPIAITTLSDDFMRTNAIENLDQIRHHTPSLAIGTASLGVNTPVISLRGQRTSEAAIHLEGAVPMYMSEVVLTPSAGTNMAMYDLESIQVLKGPQGTLFGRNSTGGALLLTPKAPGEIVGGYAQLTYGNYSRIGTDFAVDLPVNDKLSFRVSGKTVDRDGYQKNVLTGEELWDEKSRALRISMLARPTDNLSNLLIMAWDKNDTKGVQPRLESYRRDLSHLFADDLERSLARDPMRVESDQPGQREDIENWFLANTTEYEVGNVILKNILGYRKVDMTSIYDADGSAVPFANMALDGKPTTVSSEMISNEFQVLGTAFDDKLSWIAGAYYWQLDGKQYNRSNINQQVPVGPGIFLPINFDNIQGGEVENSAWAVFAQGSYDITDRLEVTLGARWSWDRRELDLRNHRLWYQSPDPRASGKLCTVEGDNGLPLPSDACSRTVKDNWNSPTWLASANYKVGASSMVYGSITTGYRAGGFSIRATNLDEQQPFDEESVITYEVGLKSDWTIGEWDFRTNIALYTQSFDDIQRTVSQQASDGSAAFITLTTNAAEATIKGGEVEIHASSSSGIDFMINYSHVDTEYKKYIDPRGIDASGSPIEFVPKDQLTATIRYTLPISQRFGDLSLQASYYQQSRYLATLYTGNDPIEDRIKHISSYSLMNYTLDWRSLLGTNFDASLYVKNAQNKRHMVGGLPVVESLGVGLFHYGEPRTYGMSVRYNF